jgi:hypothetical protein
LSLTYEFSKQESVTFKSLELLGADDLRVLQGIVALAGPHGVAVGAQPASSEGMLVRQSLKVEGDGETEEILYVKTSYRKLAKEIGYANPDDIRPIRDCIERMYSTTIIVRKGSRSVGVGHMLAAYDGDEADGGGLLIGLNTKLAKAIMGGGQFVYIDMAEVRALSTDPARLIHQRLCGFINPGGSYRFNLDTLCGYIWPIDDAAKSPSSEAMKRRRQTARKALGELSELGWTIEEYARAKFEITRPKRPGLPS